MVWLTPHYWTFFRLMLKSSAEPLFGDGCLTGFGSTKHYQIEKCPVVWVNPHVVMGAISSLLPDLHRSG